MRGSFVAIAVFAASSICGQSTKLSELAPPLVGDTHVFRLSPDGDWLVYSADEDVDELVELYSVRTDGSQVPVKLNIPIVGGGLSIDADFPGFAIAPGGTRVVYAVGGELFSVPIDGSGPSVKLNGPLVAGGSVLGFGISPDGARVVYRADELVLNTYELFSVPLDGSQARVKLNDTLIAGGDVQGEFLGFPGLFQTFERFVQFTPDGSGLVYMADQDTNDVFDLYSVPTDGGASPIKLTVSSGTRDARSGFRITADGTRVVYTADQDTDEVFELYARPIDASASAVKLSGPMASGGDVQVLGVSPLGSRVVYVADQNANELFELFSVPADGSQAAVRLNGTLVTGGDVSLTDLTSSGAGRGFLIRADGNRVVYRADQDTNGVEELYSVAIDGSAPAVRLNSPLPAGRRVQASFQLGPDGTQAFYIADQDADDVDELYGVASAGGLAPVKLNGSLPVGGDVSFFGLSPDGQRVVYVADEALDGRAELFSSPTDGSLDSLLLNGPLAANGGVWGYFLVTSDSSLVAYQAELDAPGVREVFVSEIDSGGLSTKLNGPLVPGAISGRVKVFQLAAGGDVAVYLADQQSDGNEELYSVPVDGSMGSTRIAGSFSGNESLFVAEFQVSPGGDRALFLAELEADSRELYSVPVDGGATAIVLNAPLVGAGLGAFALDETTGRAVYAYGGLHSVPINGSAAPVRLTPSVSVASFQVSRSGGWVAYLALRSGGPATADLFAVPIEAGRGPLRLSSPLVIAGGSPTNYSYQISSRGNWVVYRADRDGNKVFELFAAPTTRFAHARRAPPRVRLSAPLSGGRDVSSFDIDPDETRVAYLADQEVNDRVELYSVPVDGRGEPVKLNAALPSGGSVRDGFRFSPDGMRVVFVADFVASGMPEIFSVLADGSQPAIRLGLEPVAGGGVLDFELSPDGAHVVYLADQEVDQQMELYSVPIDGSAAPTKLNGTLPAAGDVSAVFRIAPDSSRVVFVADQAAEGVHELFGVPIDGSTAPVVLNGALLQGDSLIQPCMSLGCTPSPSFLITPDSSRVLYLADRELFSSPLLP